MTKIKLIKRHMWEETRTWVIFIISLLVIFGNDYVGYLEGKYFPVTSFAKLEETGKISSDGLYIYEAKADKFRDCDYYVGSIEWYLGPTLGRKQGVRATFYDKPQIRDKGILEWESLAVQLDLETIELNSHSYVYHQCPFRPWKTRTLFYDSSKGKTNAENQ